MAIVLNVVTIHLIYACCGCKQNAQNIPISPPKDTETGNITRKAIGLRVIDTNWYYYGRQWNADDWKLSLNSPYPAKRVQRNPKNEIIWEEDYYYSGAKYLDHEGYGNEHIVIHYDYEKHVSEIYYIGTNDVCKNVVIPFDGGTNDHSKVVEASGKIFKSWKETGKR